MGRGAVTVTVLLLISTVFAQNQCTTDLNRLQNSTYPYGHILRDATGSGLYGYYQPMHSAFFDPGKWTVCEALESGISNYCYMYQEGGSNPEKFVVGACVPGSCTTDELNNETALFLSEALHLPELFALGVRADCPVKQSPGAGTYIIAALYALLISLAVAGTLIDLQLTHKVINFRRAQDDDFETGTYKSLMRSEEEPPKRPEKLEEKHSNLLVRILLSFSFTYNMGRLVAPSPPGSFSVLNGVRVLAMAFVVLGHTFYFLWDTMALLNSEEIVVIVRQFRFQIVVAGFYAVDTFFFLSGFLVCYLFVQELQHRGINVKVLFMYYFHRFYRLTPALFMGLMYFWLITPYLSDGPYWPFYQKFVSNHCDNSWWWTLLYVQNFVDPSKLCMGWSWYLADDTQFYVLSPLILILYWKNKWLGWICTVIGILVCIACNIGISAKNGLQEFQGLQWGAEIGNYIPPTLKFGAEIYLPPWTRVSPYLVGFIFGFILLERGTQFRIHSLVRYSVYICSTTIILVLSFITYSDANYGWTDPMNVIWIGFSRTIWSLGLGALLLVSIVGYGGVFNYLMSFEFWVPLARLSYSAYLFHLSNIGVIYNGYKSGFTYTFSSALYFFMGHLLIAFALALVNFLLVEKPLMNIESLFLPRGKKKE